MNAQAIRTGSAVIAAALALAFYASVFTVGQMQQALVLQFGRVRAVLNQTGEDKPGLYFKLPFVENVVLFDKRVLDLDLDDTVVLSADQQRINVDAFARFRVVDPLRMVLSAGTELAVENQLRPIFGSALRNELGKRRFTELLSVERGQLMENIERGLQASARNYGVQIVDVRIKRADLPAGSALDSAINRMRIQRTQEAVAIRAEGQRRAQLLRADGDAEAARIYADAFGKDPDFYDFYRAMESYRRTFGADGNPPPAGSTVFVLSPNDSYLKQFFGRTK